MGIRRGTRRVRADKSQVIPTEGYEGLLRLVPKPAPKHTPTCYFCGGKLPDGREKYCKDTHARSANDLKWGRAVKALHAALAALPDCPTLPLTVIQRTLAEYGRRTPKYPDTRGTWAERRARRDALMASYGLVYHERTQTWTTL